jgi:hypothetical protein
MSDPTSANEAPGCDRSTAGVERLDLGFEEAKTDEAGQN